MWMNVNLESITAAGLHSVSTQLAVTCVPVSTASLGMEKTALVSFSFIYKYIFAPLCLLEDSLLSLLGIIFLTLSHFGWLIDINECQSQHGGCHPAASCTNSPGSYNCTCPFGMTGSGFDCQDVDECNKNSTLPHNCSLLAMCNNTEASYFCKCMEGYQGDGFTCDDVDECLSPSICENMTCQNFLEHIHAHAPLV